MDYSSPSNHQAIAEFAEEILAEPAAVYELSPRGARAKVDSTPAPGFQTSPERSVTAILNRFRPHANIVEVEEGPTVGLCNYVLIEAIENNMPKVSIFEADGQTCIAFSGGTRDEDVIRLPAYVLPRLVMRYINMLQWTKNEDLILAGTIAVRWRGENYRIQVAIRPQEEGLGIDLLCERE